MNDTTIVNVATQLSGFAYAARVLDHSATQLEWLRERVPDGDFAGRGYFLGMSPFAGGGHELYIERIDYVSSPPALIVRNPWGSSPPGVRHGDPVAPSLPLEITAEDPARGTIRIPLTPTLMRAQMAIHYPL